MIKRCLAALAGLGLTFWALTAGAVIPAAGFAIWKVWTAVGLAVHLFMGVGAAQVIMSEITPTQVSEPVLKVRFSGTPSGAATPEKIDIPAKVGQALERPAAAPAGEGTLENPLPYTHSRLRVFGGTWCGVPAQYASDQAVHYLPQRLLTPNEALTECAALKATYDTRPREAPYYGWAGEWDPSVEEHLKVLVSQPGTPRSYYVWDACFQDGVIQRHSEGEAGGGCTTLLRYVVEPEDGVKRMVTASTGISVDKDDPDWTPEEKADADMAGPGSVVVRADNGEINQASVQNGRVVVGRSVQDGSNVRTTILIISEEGALSGTSDSSSPGLVDAQGAPLGSGSGSSGAGSGSGSGSQGGSCGGAGQPACAIDDSGFNGKDAGAGAAKSAVDQAYLDREGKLNSIKDTSPGIVFDWLPNMKPGLPVACSALTYSPAITHGPASGLGGTYSLDICDQLGVIRGYMAWLVSVLTAYYLWGALMRANGGKDR